MAAYSGRLLTAGIETALTAVSLNVGVGVKPSSVGWSGTEDASTFVPYTIIWPVVGGTSDGTMSVPFDDVQPDYIITSYGSTVAQAQWGADKVRAALTAAGAVTVSGRSILLVSPDVEPGAIPDYDVTPPVFFSPSRWRIHTTAA